MIDELDAQLIDLLAAEPRVGVLEASRRLGVARGTVQARLDRLRDRSVITGYGPDVDPAAIGFRVTAFVTLEIRQAGGHDPVTAKLALIAEVLEAHTITGQGDMLCRVVARDNADLQRVIDAIVDVPGSGTHLHGYRPRRPHRLPHPAPGPGRRHPRLATHRRHRGVQRKELTFFTSHANGNHNSGISTHKMPGTREMLRLLILI